MRAGLDRFKEAITRSEALLDKDKQRLEAILEDHAAREKDLCQSYRTQIGKKSADLQATIDSQDALIQQWQAAVGAIHGKIRSTLVDCAHKQDAEDNTVTTIQQQCGDLTALLHDAHTRMRMETNRMLAVQESELIALETKLSRYAEVRAISGFEIRGILNSAERTMLLREGSRFSEDAMNLNASSAAIMKLGARLRR